ncbi:hypothetical protein [Amycolatopsis balhimycina]|uniref:hypothetical protein n=1 Tax=Amycolatopsis balhimycina TaxID=208443 RepID=UPI00035E8FE4|nr:hypothetical protein [Amycolatopsis balhimycina]
MPDGEVIGHARNIAAAGGLFLAIGSSLEVEPARAGATLVIVDRDPTPYDEDAAFVLRDDIEATVPELCAAVTR